MAVDCLIWLANPLHWVFIASKLMPSQERISFSKPYQLQGWLQLQSGCHCHGVLRNGKEKERKCPQGHIAGPQGHIASLQEHIASLQKHIASLQRHIARPQGHIVSLHRHIASPPGLNSRVTMPSGALQGPILASQGRLEPILASQSFPEPSKAQFSLHKALRSPPWPNSRFTRPSGALQDSIFASQAPPEPSKATLSLGKAPGTFQGPSRIWHPVQMDKKVSKRTLLHHKIIWFRQPAVFLENCFLELSEAPFSPKRSRSLPRANSFSQSLPEPEILHGSSMCVRERGRRRCC